MDIYAEVISNTAMSSNFINTLYIIRQPAFCIGENKSAIIVFFFFSVFSHEAVHIVTLSAAWLIGLSRGSL